MAEPHKDRRTGLIAFGVLQILLGCFLFLLLLRTAATARVDAAQSLFLFGVATFYFIATGIGSVRGRRTARALIAAVSGAWTAIGAFGVAALIVLQPSLSAAKIIFAVVMIALPLVLTLFYSSRDTALTADELDPHPRWTDRAPVPVLALCVVLAFSAIETMMNAGREALTLFGRTLTGAPAALAMIALGILFANVAIQAYRLREYAWWVLVLLHVIGGAASATSLAQNDVLRGAALWAISVVGWIAYLGFLIWLRRYFVARRGEVAAPVLSSTAT